LSRTHSILLTLVCACMFALAAPAWARAAETALPKGCPDFKGKPTGYMIGSSTMGSVMGPMLKGMLKRRWKVESRHWGKASSGLARPDFHNWPQKARGLMARYKPDFVIVSLGTNDNQALRVGKKWLPHKRKEKWEKLYAKRVRKMLKTLAGPDLARPIVWMGPTAFEGRTARILGPRISAIMEREVEAFEGNATYIDVYRSTRKPNGKMVTQFQAPDRKQPEGLRGHDGIHLTARAVKYLMAEPVLNALEPCFAGHLAQWKEAEKRRAEERRLKAQARRANQERLKAERKAKRVEAHQARVAEKQKEKEARLEARRLRLAKKKKSRERSKRPDSKATSSKAAEATPNAGASKKTSEKPSTVTSEATKRPLEEAKAPPAKPKSELKPTPSEKAKSATGDRASKPPRKATAEGKSDDSATTESGAKE
jgi:hypothetical protein